MNRRFYRFLCAVLGVWYGLFFRPRMDGMENIPAIACKHRYFHFMAKTELFKWKPLAAIVRSLGGFPVDRGNSDLGAVRTSLKLIADGHGLAIFPQGTRVKDNHPAPMLEGVSMIAMRANAPVIPAYIGGPFRLFRKTQLSFGPPVSFEGLPRRVDSDTLDKATRRIEAAVWGLKR